MHTFEVNLTNRVVLLARTVNPFATMMLYCTLHESVQLWNLIASLGKLRHEKSQMFANITRMFVCVVNSGNFRRNYRINCTGRMT